MLDFGYRSRCCRAPIRLGKRKKDNIIKSVWVCTKCRKSNIDIIPNEELDIQGNYKSGVRFSDEQDI
jgi:hypothetical protein